MLILFEVYFELLFSALLSLYTPEENLNFTFLTFFNGGIILFMVTLVVPVAVLYVLTRSQERLEEKDFKESWGMIYSDCKT